MLNKTLYLFFEQEGLVVVGEQFNSFVYILQSLFIWFSLFFGESSSAQGFEHEIFIFANFLKDLHVFNYICAIFDGLVVSLLLYVCEGSICVNWFQIFDMFKGEGIEVYSLLVVAFLHGLVAFVFDPLCILVIFLSSLLSFLHIGLHRHKVGIIFGQDRLLFRFLIGVLDKVVPFLIEIDGALFPHGCLSFLKHFPFMSFLFSMCFIWFVVLHH